MTGTVPPPAGLSTGQKAATGGGLVLAALGSILAAVYANEGGFVNHPRDPGGATNHGVTEKVARQHGYQGNMRDFQKHCSERHAVCADSIYIRDYIERPGFLPLVSIEPAVADELVDTGVNMGPRWPSRWFQESLSEMGVRIAIDGQVGPATIKAYRTLQQLEGKVPACVQVLDKLDAKQKARYDRLVKLNPNNGVFYRGWIRLRIGNVDRRDCGKGWE